MASQSAPARTPLAEFLAAITTLFCVGFCEAAIRMTQSLQAGQPIVWSLSHRVYNTWWLPTTSFLLGALALITTVYIWKMRPRSWILLALLWAGISLIMVSVTFEIRESVSAQKIISSVTFVVLGVQATIYLRRQVCASPFV